MTTAATGPRTLAAVLVAAGSGERLGAGMPKAFVEIGGSTLLEHAARPFLRHPAVGAVVVVAPAADLERAAALTRAVGLTHARVVAGGATRQLSVEAGLRAVRADYVLVHDVARPFVPADVIDRVLAALESGADAVVPVVPIHDTVRQVRSDGTFAGVVDRSMLVATQTPQGFRRDVLIAAHESGRTLQVTDDAALVEAAGGVVVPVRGADDSFKVTTAADLLRAAAAAGPARR